MMMVPSRDRAPATSTERLPGATPQPSPIPPPRAQTVTNNLSGVSATGNVVGAGPIAGVKDTNIRGSMDGVETVRVTDITASSAFTKSIGSLFSTINKSVSSAFSSLMAAPPQPPTTGADAFLVGGGGGGGGGSTMTPRIPLNGVAEASRTSAAVQPGGGAGNDSMPMSTIGIGQNVGIAPTAAASASAAAAASLTASPAGISRHYSPGSQARNQMVAPADRYSESTVDQQDGRMRNQLLQQQQQQQQQQHQLPNNGPRG
jgi:hypothetical protein